jgi:VanZ like family
LVSPLPSSPIVTDPPHGQSSRPDLKSLRMAAAVIWTLAIMTLCWLPSDVVDTVEESSSWFEIHDFDKAVHCVLFLVFAVLWCRIWSFRGRYAVVGLMAIGLAALTELVQLLPAIGRDGNVADGATDMLGCVIGLALVPLVEPLLRSIETRLFRAGNA